MLTQDCKNKLVLMSLTQYISQWLEAAVKISLRVGPERLQYLGVEVGCAGVI